METYYDFQQNEEQQITLQDYLRIIYGGRWIILVSFIVVMIATVIYTFTTPKVYEASGKIIVESQGTMERALFNMNFYGNQTTLISNQVEVLKSRQLAEEVVRTLETVPYRDSLQIFQPDADGVYMDFRKQVEWIMGNLEVTPKRDTDVIEVKFSAGSPFEAYRICNVIMDSYRNLNRDFNLSELKELRQFLEKQLEKKGEELRKSEEALKKYREEQKLVALDDATRELITRMAESQAQLENAVVELDALLEQKKSLESQLENRKKSLSADVAISATPLLKELQENYAKLVSEKVTYETLLSQDRIDPSEYKLQLQSIQNRLEAVKQRLQEEATKIAATSMIQDPLMVAQDLTVKILEAETQIKALRAKISALQDVVNEYDYQLAQLPSQGLELVRLTRQMEVDQNTYMLMTQKLEETRITLAGKRENVRILDYAIVPEFPVKPKKKLNLLLGIIIGLGLGIGLTFMLEYFDDSIKNPDELEKIGFPILATIPEISPQEVLKKIRTKQRDLEDLPEAEQIATRLISHFDPKSPISEAYRTFRTNIQFKHPGKDGDPIVVLVTSSAPKEGKSTTVANLAITMAQLGSKTVLVDTDLRRPVIHSIFSQRKEMGTTNYLLEKATLDDIIKPTFVDNLSIITSGSLPPNPSELLGSGKMKKLIEDLKGRFDAILFDTPPVIAVTDAAILSTLVDGVVLVIKAHQTHREAIKRSKYLLDNAHANIFGCLLNGLNVDRAYGSYYYYYYYYHYYQYYGHDLKRRNKGK
ncbi:MAG: polysaccharide biosynthesis tyrosine autokinase [Calditrichia bacterium]